MNSYINFSHVTKTFGAFKALNDVSLEIPRGTFVTLLGPSGCGKTTLLRLLSGFSEPDAGEIRVDGHLMNNLPPFKRGTPLVFQDYALFPHMTLYENIAYGLKIKGTKKEEIDRRVAEMLELFNLRGMEQRFPKQLSGGQQQRVAIARALILKKEVLLLDEPLSNLDAKLRVDVRNELRQIQEKLGITLIYVTHDQDEALSMSDLIAVMQGGKIEQIGTPWQIYFRPENRFVADFVGTVNLIEARVVAAEKERLTVDWNEQPFAFRYEGSDFNIGEAIELMIRPECFQIHSLGENELVDAGDLSGEVTFFSFLGRFIRYFVRVHEQILILDDSNPGEAGAIEGPVRVTIDWDKVHILRKKN